MIGKIILIILFIVGLWYILWPGKITVNDLPPLPDSLKSDEPYDTYLLPNTAAYFSDLRRPFVTAYYKEEMQNFYCPDNFFKLVNIFCYIEPMRLNHPIEDSNFYIRDRVLVTYLEEYTYPLKSSLFINGYEPYNEQGVRFSNASYPIIINDILFQTKTTLRIYQPEIIWQLIIYIFIWLSLITSGFLFKKVRKE